MNFKERYHNFSSMKIKSNDINNLDNDVIFFSIFKNYTCF